MGQAQSQDKVRILNSDLKLDNIPDDATLAIIKAVQEWGESRGTIQKRERERRARDATLRAVSLCNHKLYDVWHPKGLLSSMTFGFTESHILHAMLERHPDYGEHIKSLRFIKPKQIGPMMLPNLSKGTDSQTGVRIFILELFSKLPQLQTLILEEHLFQFFPFPHGSSKLVPHPLVNTLKKLFIPIQLNLLARNVIWILVHCVALEECALGFAVLRDDFKFLDDHKDGFKGRSNVKHLSLMFYLRYPNEDDDDEDEDQKLEWRDGRKNNPAMSNLLSVTKNLVSIELNNEVHKEYSGDRDATTVLHSTCLLGLEDSYHSLRHLRLLSVTIPTPTEDSPAEEDFRLSSFSQLKTLTADFELFMAITQEELDEDLPQTIETLVLAYHTTFEYSTENVHGREEMIICTLLFGNFLQLKSLVLPSEPIDYHGKLLESPSSAFVKNRAEGFEALRSLQEEAEVKLKVYRVKKGEILCEPDFISTTWLSPP